jgi:hypothetical protein
MRVDIEGEHGTNGVVDSESCARKELVSKDGTSLSITICRAMWFYLRRQAMGNNGPREDYEN